MDFFDKENLKDIRLRTFYKYVDEDTTILSEGSYQIEFLNIGEEEIILTDVGGNTWRLLPGFPFDFNRHILPGHPGIIRDDIIKVKFVDTGNKKQLQVKFERFVRKGDTNIYPGQAK